MKPKYIFLFLLIFLPFVSYAQDWEIINFESDEDDLYARLHKKCDENKNPCALIKVSIDSENVKFSGDIVGDVEKKEGYWFVYVPEGSRWLTIIVENKTPIEVDFREKNIDPQRMVTYVMKLRKRQDNRSSTPKPKIGFHSVIVGINSGTICGDYFGFYAEVKLGRLGRPNGIGFEFGYGPGLDSGQLYNDNWTIGLKGYTRGWYLSANYGTTLPIYGKKLSGEINADGTIIQDGARDYGRYGFDFLIGYDKSFNWFHFEIGAGVIVPTKNTKFLPAWTIGLGVDIFKLIKW